MTMTMQTIKIEVITSIGYMLHRACARHNGYVMQLTEQAEDYDKDHTLAMLEQTEEEIGALCADIGTDIESCCLMTYPARVGD